MNKTLEIFGHVIELTPNMSEEEVNKLEKYYRISQIMKRTKEHIRRAARYSLKKHISETDITELNLSKISKLIEIIEKE